MRTVDAPGVGRLLVLWNHFRLLLLSERDKEIGDLVRRGCCLLHVWVGPNLVDSQAFLGVGLGHALDQVEEGLVDLELVRVL